MSIVNFKIPKTLEKRVNSLIKEKGFNSKAEFFRFAAINFIDILEKPSTSEEERFKYLADVLDAMIKNEFKNKKIKNLREQLSDD